uniref:DUF421 domain-containing protein n=1 Tax=Altererythrobacter segetis TaxID=1104773 RepID=UPI0014072A11|nr:YetF domain-containing protein [Altererythrobacter segetis]
MDIVLRATFMFAVIFVLLRLLGKREIAEMTPFEVVLLVVMGDLIQQGATQSDYSVTGATLAVATFGFWSLVLNWVTYTWPRAERLLDGEPQVVVRGGELLAKMMRRNRLTRSEVESEMRHAGIARLDDVAWGILETDGKISFIGKDPGGSAERTANEPDKGPA